MTKEERREYFSTYYAEHREEILANKKEWYAQNKRKCSLYHSAYYAKHREELKAKQLKRYHKMKQSHGESPNRRAEAAKK